MKTKTISCLYQQMEVNFLLHPFNSNIMINATQMAKIFDKQIDNFIRLEGTQKFIKALIVSENSKFAPSDVREQITENKIIYATNKATFMHRKLAIYFAFWLDVNFQIWIIDTIDNILFGNYKKHWDAHTMQEEAKEKMILIKEQILTNPTAELVEDYFRNEEIVKNTGLEKRKAIKNQIHLFNYLQENN